MTRSAPATVSRAVRLLIQGRVQNVGYRVFVAREAGRLHLNGFVRNRRDGSVETLVEGQPDVVEEFMALAIKGPRTVSIEKFHISEAGTDALAEYKALAIDHDADGFFSAPVV